NRRHVLARRDRPAPPRPRCLRARRTLLDDRPAPLRRLVPPDRPLVMGAVPVRARPQARRSDPPRPGKPLRRPLLVVRLRIPRAAPRLGAVHVRAVPDPAGGVLPPRLDRSLL